MSKPKLVVAVLDTMWGGAGQAPRFFPINPNNNSGRRLYRLVGVGARLLVTNCCKEYVSHAHKHGIPDRNWLKENLRRLRPHVILVCGKVSAKTFQTEFANGAKVIYMDHPAARRWTMDNIMSIQERIREAIWD